jgi:DNA-binding CsgD family transcriptional regulator
VRVLRCVAEQAEARLSFVGLADLADPIADEHLDALPGPQREALEVALVRRAGTDRPPDATAVGVGLRALLVRAAEDGPLIVAIDDVQWLDAPTARALAFAVRRLDGLRIGVLGTVRTPLTAPDPLGLERAFGPRLRRARLGPLGVDAVRGLIESRLGHAYRRPTLVKIAQASGGNPLFALEIGRALGPAPALEPGAPLPVPESLREIVAGRIERLDPQARHALLVAAALSHPTVELVERASSAAGLLAAEESGLLLCVEGDRLAFAHPLYASAVYGAAASGRRRSLHKCLADMVSEPEEQVRHRALAAAQPDEEVAAALERAAASARARGAWESAGELLEQARALTPDARPYAARDRGLRAAEHHIHAGDRPRARALLEAILADAPPGPARSDALRLLAEIVYNEDGFGDAAGLLEEALRDAREPALAAAIELDLCYVRCNRHGDVAGADEPADRALAHAARVRNPTLLGEALAVRAMIDFLLGRGIDWEALDRAVALEGSERPVPLYLWPSAIAAVLKLWVGRYDEARAELTALRLQVSDSGDESDLAYLLTWLAALECVSGDFAAAEALADEALTHAALAGSEFNRAWALSQRATVRAYRGDAAAARADAEAATAICARFEAPLPMLWVAAAIGVLELSLGDGAAAWDGLAPYAEALEARGGGTAFAILLVPAIEALVARGELETAERRLDRLEQTARANDRLWARAESARCRALLLAARGDLEAAALAAERALEHHARAELPFERARALLAQGQIARRRKQKRAARESLDAALALFEELGAREWAERAREDIARLGRKKQTELTESEGRVARLAADGLSNKEIAQALFVTVHTVEVHLSRAYAKLGIRRRGELAARLAIAPEV